VSGDDRDEEPTVVNLLADVAVPGIATPQFALVEPHLDVCAAHRRRDPLRGRRVL
jgi:hypothetical protein